MERRFHRSPYELLQQELYAPEEMAELLGIGIAVVRHAAFTGEPRAQIIEHHIVAIRRADILTWLRVAEGPARGHTLRPMSEVHPTSSTGTGGDH